MKRKVNTKNVIIIVFIIVGLILTLILVNKKNFIKKDNSNQNEQKEVIENFKNFEIKKVQDYSEKHHLELNIVYEFSDDIEKDFVISSNLEGKKLSVIVSKGSIPLTTYQELKVNELGKVPIMMYHGIREKTSNSTGTIGGNVDKDGYNRTPDAFREDLEFYYQNNYRMVRLIDYANDLIETELGKSPLILTFDDGNADNFKVIGKNADGSLKFDPDSAIGILEEFKKKYPDFKVTATFFLTGALCNQPDYNQEIMKWLVANGYDIGNHTKNHLDIKTASSSRVQQEIVYVYQQLDEIIPNKYVPIIALPFGSPYSKSHSNYKYVLKSTDQNKTYETEVALRVGWEPEVSPFDKTFDRTYLKRCRAYDNNGQEFDIKMVFKMLEKTRYISDGEKDFITIPKDLETRLKEIDKKIITY